MAATMKVLLPPADTLLSGGTWCEQLAQRIADSTSLEWHMRLLADSYRADTPRARYPNGVPAARHQVGAGGAPWFSSADVAGWLAGMGFSVNHQADPEQLPPSPPAPPAPAEPALRTEQSIDPQANDLADTSLAPLTQAEEGARSAIETALGAQREEAAAPSTDMSDPPPISSADIAAAFDGIKWSRDEWMKNLGKGEATAKWLTTARVQRGQPGPDRPSKWNPLKIGTSLVENGIPASPPALCPPTPTQVARMVRSRFATVPYLLPWHQRWIEHERVLREFGTIQ